MPKRTMQGRVVSKAGDKTVIVNVERRLMHPLYKKFIRRSRNFAAHDETNGCKVGDSVTIQESRPYSKTKQWEIVAAA